MGKKVRKIKKVGKNSRLKVAHEMARGLYNAGIINAATMRKFDILCSRVGETGWSPSFGVARCFKS